PEDAAVRRYLLAFAVSYLLALFLGVGLYLLGNHLASTRPNPREAVRQTPNPESNAPRPGSQQPLTKHYVYVHFTYHDRYQSLQYQELSSLLTKPDSRVDVFCSARIPGSDKFKTELVARNILVAGFSASTRSNHTSLSVDLEVTAEQAEQIS